MIERLLIANRGEIACRIMRTARRLGIHTIAVYSDADARAAHVALADEAHRIGPAPALESYLSIPAILAAAERSRAQAIHPGYGFLSESAPFARACEEAGITFVGPPAAAIEEMGSKAAARALMEAAGVPVVPGYHGDAQDGDTLARAAAAIGYPVLVKAAAGGGGRGMRIAARADALAEAAESARREALAAFGDDRLILERFVDRPRHVEVQVFGDHQGNVVHVFERDCSLQRRHQKVVEEAPAPDLAPAVRDALCDAAVRAARAVGYVNAGTVEFIVAPDDAVYFLEMNTRLQVEHPATELVTRQDLVEWQLRVASGEPLPVRQDELRVSGHAVEARVYAEDPGNGFLPSSGRIKRLRLPAEDAHVRVDAGFREGDTVPLDYDSLVAKVIVWDHTRAEALRRLRRALRAVQIVGPVTNVGFLSAIAEHEAFLRGPLDTRFLDRCQDELLPAATAAPERSFALAALGVIHDRHQESTDGGAGEEAWSPWRSVGGWRLNDEHHDEVVLRDGHQEIRVTVRYCAEGYVLDMPSGPVRARARVEEDGHLHAELDGARVWAMIVRQGEELTVVSARGTHRLFVEPPLLSTAPDDTSMGRMTAPMPGRIVRVPVATGDRVERGATLLALEAMKMEHTLVAPADGEVVALHCEEGDVVAEGAELVEFRADG